MTTRFGKSGKWVGLAFALTAAMAMPFSVAARGHGGHSGHHGYSGNHGYSSHRGYSNNRGYRGGNYGYNRGHRRGGHWNGGRWIGGAIVAGAVFGLVNNALSSSSNYYERPVVYTRPRTVIYENGAPIVRERVVERTVYEDPYGTRYVRDDGYNGY